MFHSYNRGNMARKFLPDCRKQSDYEWVMQSPQFFYCGCIPYYLLDINPRDIASL